jgi:DNA-binding CsgD family transcriptional regulator
MSATDVTENALERREAVPPPAFHRPAELVDASERLYRQAFHVGLWVAVAFTGLALVASLLVPAGSRAAALSVSGAILAGVVPAAAGAGSVYGCLRRRSWMLVVVGAILGGGALTVGRYNSQLFLPMTTIIGVAGLATPRYVVLVAGLIAGTGLGAPQFIQGPTGDLVAAVAVPVPPVMFWLVIERIAGFALRLNQTLEKAPGPAVESADNDGPDDGSRVSQRARGHADGPRGLPEPEIIDVAGIRLTSRQLQVVLLKCEGLKDGEIAACLRIGPQQVRRHVRGAERRTGSNSTPQLVAWALQAGLAPRARPPGAVPR